MDGSEECAPAVFALEECIHDKCDESCFIDDDSTYRITDESLGSCEALNALVSEEICLRTGCCQECAEAIHASRVCTFENVLAPMYAFLQQGLSCEMKISECGPIRDGSGTAATVLSVGNAHTFLFTTLAVTAYLTCSG